MKTEWECLNHTQPYILIIQQHGSLIFVSLKQPIGSFTLEIFYPKFYIKFKDTILVAIHFKIWTSWLESLHLLVQRRFYSGGIALTNNVMIMKHKQSTRDLTGINLVRTEQSQLQQFSSFGIKMNFSSKIWLQKTVNQHLIIVKHNFNHLATIKSSIFRRPNNSSLCIHMNWGAKMIVFR